MHSGPADVEYWVSYEEWVEVYPGDALRGRHIWVDAAYPWYKAATLEQCLRRALGWVNAGEPDNEQDNRRGR